jgi:hypothetical protein
MTWNNAAGRQYREYADGLYAKARADNGLMSLADFPDVEPLKDGDCWGPWRFQRSDLTLQYDPQDRHWWYEIDLERMTNSAAMLDVIFQISNKRESCCSTEDIGHLISALNDLLNPQANICSFGTNATLDATKYLDGEIKNRKFEFIAK